MSTPGSGSTSGYPSGPDTTDPDGPPESNRLVGQQTESTDDNRELLDRLGTTRGGDPGNQKL